MKMLKELKKGILTRFNNSTIYSVDGIKLYEDHMPSSKTYPFVVFYHVSSVNKYAMIDTTTGHTNGYDYLMPARIQFTIYANDRQNVEMEDIADKLEDLYNKQKIALANDCTNFGTLLTGSRTKFDNQQQKIWSISQDYNFFVGK